MATYQRHLPDDALLRNKVNKHVMEDLPQRSKRVRGFLEFFKPGLVYDIVPINDVYGPTAWDPNIQALVVSKETLGGATESASFFSQLLLAMNIPLIFAQLPDIGKLRAFPPSRFS